MRRQLAVHDAEIGEFAKVEVFVKDFMKITFQTKRGFLWIDGHIPIDISILTGGVTVKAETVAIIVDEPVVAVFRTWRRRRTVLHA